MLMLRCCLKSPRMFTQTTIKDVARAAGVHFTTVSMALRGHPAIATRTRIRIESVAKLIGYQHNSIFSALSHQRDNRRQTRPIPALLYLGRVRGDRHFFGLDHHRQLVAGATKAAKAMGYRLEIRIVGPSGIAPGRLDAYLARTTAVGVLIGAWDPTLEVPAVNWHRLPTVKIDSRHVPADVPFFSFDQMKCVIDSVGQLHTRGYRRIGMALGEKDEDATDGLHLSGWLVTKTQFPEHTAIPPLLFPPGASDAEVLPLLRAWIRQNRPDAIMCNWSSIQSLLRSLHDPGINRLGCVCLCRGTRQRLLAGIVPNLELVGQRAVSFLGSIISAPPDKTPDLNMNCYVEGTWHDGPSIQPQD